MDLVLFATSAAVVKGASYINSNITPSSEAYVAKTAYASATPAYRMALAAVYQFLNANPVCDDADLTGQFILLTGGNSGIGFETAKGLVARGADVTIIGRTEKRLIEAVDRIKDELQAKDSLFGSIHCAVCDVSDLSSIDLLVDKLSHGDKKIDQLILNAGVWPQEYAESKNGFEIAFATNTLGSFFLLTSLIRRHLLKTDARVIALVGEIYITLADNEQKEDCTPHFAYNTAQGCQDAYCRSKLGLLWLFNLVHAKHPSYHMYTVCPGMVDNTLAGSNSLPKSMLISNEQGAQTTLICATVDCSLLHNGGYYHNTLGRLILPPEDPALNAVKAQALWDTVEDIIAKHTAHAKTD